MFNPVLSGGGGGGTTVSDRGFSHFVDPLLVINDRSLTEVVNVSLGNLMYEMSLRFEGILWLWNEVSFKGRCTAQQEQKVKQMTEVARVSDNPTFLLILQHSQGPIVVHPLHLNLPSLPWPGPYHHSLYKRTQEPTWVIKCTPVFLLAICLRLCTCSVLTQSKKAFPPAFCDVYQLGCQSQHACWGIWRAWEGF